MRRRAAQGCGYVLAVLLPFTLAWPLGQPAAAGIYPLYVTPALMLTDLPVLGLLALALTRHAPVGRWRRWLGGLLGGLAVLALLGLPWALSPALAAYSALRWALAAGLFWALARLDLPRERLLQVFLGGLCLQVLVGLGQVLHGAPLGLPAELALPLDNPRAAVVYAAGRAWLRAYGLTFHPNVLGGFLTVGLALGLPLLRRPAWRAAWLWLGVGLLLTFSRSAWLAAALSVLPAGAWLAWKHPDLRRGILVTLGGALLVAAVAGVLLAGPILTRLRAQTSAESTSLSARAELIQVALREMRLHPWTGVGAGNFPLAQQHYATQDPPHYVHNVPLLLAAEVGLGGGLLWLALWLAPLLGLPIRRPPAAGLVALAAAWFALGCVALWDSYPWALECGRLLSAALLAFTARALDGADG